MVTERPEHFKQFGWEKFIDQYAALEEIDPHIEVQYDSETTGLGSFMTEKLNAYQLGIPGKQFVFDAYTVPVQAVKKILESRLVLGHNIGFDMPYLFQAGIVPLDIYDTMIAETCLIKGLLPLPGREKTLAALTWRYLGIKLDKDTQSTIHLGIRSVEDILYSGRDVIHLPQIRDEQAKTAARRQLEGDIKFQNAYLLMNTYLEFSGVMVDKDALDRWIRNCEADEIIALRKLTKEYGELNWASPKQVGEKLKEHGIEHINPETGNLITDDDILNKYDLPICRDLQELREAAKMVSTYGRKWYSYIMPDGRIHTKYKPIVDTGRTSCGEVDRRRYDPWDLNYKSEKPFPNMQNPPKKRKGFRDVFVPKKGNVLVVCDFSGQESVILADQSEDPNMMKLFGEEGRDPHCYVFRFAYPEHATLTDEEIKEQFPDLRDECKTAAFAIAYGGNWKTIQENLNCSEEKARHIFDSYMAAFPTLTEFFAHCFEFAWKRGYMPTDWVVGGKRFFDHATRFREWKEKKSYWRRYYKEKEEDTDWYKEEAEKMKWYTVLNSTLRKESVNTRIQGTGAVMSKLAGIYFFNWILKEKLFGKVLVPIFVHDEWVVECHKKSAEKVAAAIQECMERAGKQCLKHLTIKAEPKVCLKWEK